VLADREPLDVRLAWAQLLAAAKQRSPSIPEAEFPDALADAWWRLIRSDGW